MSLQNHLKCSQFRGHEIGLILLLFGCGLVAVQPEATAQDSGAEQSSSAEPVSDSEPADLVAESGGENDSSNSQRTGPGKPVDASTRTLRKDRTLEYWAAQLSHERFLRRESAQRHLVAGGQAAVPVLRKMLGQGDLETVEGVISVLTKIGENEEPWRTDGAIATLEVMAGHHFGTKATLAKSALTSFAESRGQEARVQLSGVGVFVGTETVALGARSRARPIVRIDDDFNGDVETLAWLRWVNDVNFVVISGAAATPQVFEAVAKMPNLATVVLIDCQLTMQAIEKLHGRARLDAMELRYVPLNAELINGLSKVRLRNSLYLMGTGLSEDQVQRMRVEMPGLEITHRRGGFLGVICRSTLEDFCQVSEVMPESGAADAGLRSGDIIIRIDDVKITRFDDLQRQVNTHFPGDAISIRYRRGGKVTDTSATLKKLKNQ